LRARRLNRRWRQKACRVSSKTLAALGAAEEVGRAGMVDAVLRRGGVDIHAAGRIADHASRAMIRMVMIMGMR
jgi:hypothetical protein